MATEYIYKLVREDWNHPPGKRTKTITRDKPDLRIGGLYVHLGRGYPGCQRILSMELREEENREC